MTSDTWRSVYTVPAYVHLVAVSIRIPKLRVAAVETGVARCLTTLTQVSRVSRLHEIYR